MRKLLSLLGALLICQSLALAVPDAVFDVKALTSTPLNPRTLKSSEVDGIVTEEVMFHAEKDGDKDVEIFAFFSYPKGAKSLPAYIWNQGGLGQASPFWTEDGAKRGYAVLCIDFPLPGYRSSGAYRIADGLEVGDDPRKAPIYHGAVALLKAVSYLESRAEVDENRIGMAGSSWGGFYTTLMAGVDPRIKAGSSMFGTGSLQLGNIWWDERGWDTKRDAAFRERWRKTLDPAWLLRNRRVPIAWFASTNDWFYWMPALMQTYAMARGPKHLSLMPNWDHGLPDQFLTQTFAFLDVHLKGAPAFNRVTPIKVLKRGRELIAQWNFSGPRKVTSADLMLSYGDKGNWTSRAWKILPATVEGQTCEAILPAATLPYHIGGTIYDADTFRYSTPLQRVNTADFGVVASVVALDYDGAGEWGGFEENHISYLRGLGFPVPPVSADAREGKQAALLKAGKTLVYPFYFTVGVPHRFSCYLKADKPTRVTLDLGGQFDGKPVNRSQEFEVGRDWTLVQMEFTPPPVLAVKLGVTFSVPEGSVVSADSLSFRPRS